MAVFALINEYLALGGTAYSDHVKDATLAVEGDQLDSTAMGDSWKEITGGLKSGTLTITFNDDFAVSSIDSVLWTAFISAAQTLTFEVRPDAGSVSTSNPKYTGTVFIAQHSVGGSVGELAAKQVSFPVTGAVTRATA